jgi:hypothetical protein
LPGFAAAGGVGWLTAGWPVASFAAFGRRVRRLFLLLLLLLLLLLVFEMCNFQGRGLVEEFVQGVKSVGGGRHWSNFVLKRDAAACPGNIVEDFFVLL